MHFYDESTQVPVDGDGDIPEISSVYFKEKTLWAGLAGEQVLTFAKRMTMGIFQNKISAEGNHSQRRLEPICHSPCGFCAKVGEH